MSGRIPGAKPTFMCGNCGERFASKNAKRRHKADCAPGSKELSPADPSAQTDDADLYGRVYVSPENKRRAAAEWAAMDWKGDLPNGWVPPLNPRARPHPSWVSDLNGEK